MPEPKPPVLLKVTIVAVALLLGASLNLFQRGGLFWGGWSGAGLERPSPARLAAPPEAGQDAAPKASPLAGGGAMQPEGASPASSPSAVKEPDGVEKADASTPEAGNEKPASHGDAPPSPEDGPGTRAGNGTGPLLSRDAAGAAAQSTPAPDDAGEAPQAADIARAPAEPRLEQPRVNTGRDKVQAARIGRSVPVGDAKPAPPDAPGAKQTRQGQGISEDAAAKAVAAMPERAGQDTADRDGAQSGVAARQAGAAPAKPAETGNGGGPGPAGGKVLDIKARENPGEFVLTIVTDGPVERVTAFHARSPARLGVDLWGDWQPSAPLARALEVPSMERLRQGVHPGKLRLVIDYKDKDLSAFGEPVLEKQPKAVIVRLPLGAASKRDGAKNPVQAGPEQ